MKYFKFLLIIGLINFSSSVFGQNVFPASGNVGIGTTSPVGNMNIVGLNTLGAKFLPNNATLNITNGTYSLLIDNNEIYSNTDLHLGCSKTSKMYFKTVDENGSLIRMTMLANGNLGLGTITPTFNLEVAGDFGVAGNRFNVQQGVINQTSTVNNWGSGSNEGGIAFNYDGRTSPTSTSQELFRDFSVYNGKGSLIAFFDGSSGRVSIGNITSPAYKLTVDGTISASEVKVSTTPNSDYVFEPDYKLKSIEEVESFIKDNKHLPDIPSAQEFQENGVGLGEMDDMLLRKVEELTLYIIELKKENKELKELILNKK